MKYRAILHLVVVEEDGLVILVLLGHIIFPRGDPLGRSVPGFEQRDTTIRDGYRKLARYRGNEAASCDDELAALVVVAEGSFSPHGRLGETGDEDEVLVLEADA